jgi:hypothetical protein
LAALIGAAGIRLVPAIAHVGHGNAWGRCRSRSPVSPLPMSTTDDSDDRPNCEPGSFVHLDVASTYSRLVSPSTLL